MTDGEHPHSRPHPPASGQASQQPAATASRRPLIAVILAAGQSKRMQSDLVKVLHEVCGRPMVAWVIDACRAVGADAIYLVVGHQADRVQAAFAGQPGLHYAIQAERLGTGHAVQQVEPLLAPDFDGDVIVLAGDGPLLRAETLAHLVQTHRREHADATLATAIIENPAGYGRIVRDAEGSFLAIVENKDATPEQLAIREINPSYYCFRSQPLFESLRRVDNRNASGEYYVTDVLGLLRRNGGRVSVIPAVPADEVLSINTQEQLAEVSAILAARMEKSNSASTT